MHNEKIRVNFDKNILKDPIIKELSKFPTKIYNGFFSMNIDSDTSTSGALGNLIKVNIIKRNYPVEYFKKKYTNTNHYDLTRSSVSIQEFIASELYRITGCKSPKQKLFLQSNPGNNYNERIDSGSKSILFSQLDYKNQLDKYISSAVNSQDFFALQEISKLMAAVLCIGDYDRNPRNYYVDHSDYLIGKMDHDRTFHRPLDDLSKYADPGFLVHVYFIEKLCGKSSSTDVTYNKITHNSEYNIRPNVKMSPYRFLDDVLFSFDDKWVYNYNFFDNKTIDSIKENPIETFMFVSYIKSIQNFLKMPYEVKEHLFSPEKLLKDTWLDIPPTTKDDLQLHCSYLSKQFQSNLRQLKQLARLPLQRLEELENYLRTNNLPIPNVEIDYRPIVKYIHTAKQNNISLHKLKEKIKGNDEIQRYGSLEL
jgi:hypothetical protein